MPREGMRGDGARPGRGHFSMVQGVPGGDTVPVRETGGEKIKYTL
jgi:hypothetical protein